VGRRRGGVVHALAGLVDDDSLGGWNDAPRRAHGEVEAAPTAAAAESARPPRRPAA